MEARAQKRSHPADSSYAMPFKRQATGHQSVGSQGTGHDTGDEDEEHEPQQHRRTDLGQDDQEQSSYGGGDEDGEDDPQSTSEQQTPSRNKPRKSGRGAGSPGSLTSGCRHDCSLGMLTKKFLTLIDNAADGILDLNKAAETLKVQKRRIYDITNVLEGVGLIEKKSKNNIRWKGANSAGDRDSEPEAARLRQDMKLMEDQERSLDEQIRVMSGAIQALTENPLNKPRLYVTDEDVTSLPCFANDTIFAVKAPPGTTLEVPDPRESADRRDGHMRYRIVLRSTKGPIDVYLVQHTNNVGTTSQQGAAPAASAEPAGSTVGPAAAAAATPAADARASASAGGGGDSAAAAAAGTTASGAAASVGGVGAPAAGTAGPPTVVKPDPVASARAPGSAMAGHGPGSPAFPFALPGNTPLSAVAAANGAASFFHSFNSPTAVAAGDHLALGAMGVSSPMLGPSRLPAAMGHEMDTREWFDDTAAQSIMSYYQYGDDEDFFNT